MQVCTWDSIQCSLFCGCCIHLMFGQWSFHWKTNNREPMIWRRHGEEEEGGVVFSTFLSLSFAGSSFCIPNYSYCQLLKLLQTLQNSGQNCYQYGSSLLYPIQCFLRSFKFVFKKFKAKVVPKSVRAEKKWRPFIFSNWN